MNVNQFNGKFAGLNFETTFQPNKDLKTEMEDAVENAAKTVEYAPKAPVEEE